MDGFGQGWPWWHPGARLGGVVGIQRGIGGEGQGVQEEEHVEQVVDGRGGHFSIDGGGSFDGFVIKKMYHISPSPIVTRGPSF